MPRMNISDHKNDLIETMMQDCMEEVETDFEAWDTKLEDLPFESHDGFWCWIDGGFQAMILQDLSMCGGSGRFPIFIQEIYEQQQTDCEESFKDETGIDYSGNYDNLTYEQKEQYWDYENNWMSEGTSFWLHIKAQFYAADNSRNKSGVDEVLFMAGVNTDFGYGRDSGLQVTYERNLPVSRCTPSVLKDLQYKMVMSLHP